MKLPAALCLVSVVFASVAFPAASKGPAEGDIIMLRVKAHVRGGLTVSDYIKEGESTKSVSHNETYASTYTSTSKWEIVGGLKPNSTQIALKKISDDFSVSGNGGGRDLSIENVRFDYSDPKNPKNKRKATRTSIMESHWQLIFPGDSKPLPARPILSLKDKTFRIEINSVGPDTPEIEGTTTFTLKDPDVNQTNTTPGSMFGTFAMALGVAAQNATISETGDKRLSGEFDPSKPFVKKGDADFIFSEDLSIQAILASLRASYSPGANISTEGRLSISYTLAYNCDPADIIAEVIPAGEYQKWLPAAGTSDGAIGNDAAFTLKLIDTKTNEEPKSVTAAFEVQLSDTSKNPGSCMNSAWKETVEDIRITKDKNPDFESVDGNGQFAKTKGGLKSSPLVLNCYDGGAFTRFKVTARLSDGQTVVAHLKGRENQTDISLPYDENHNKVADFWEDENGVTGRSLASDDDDKPAGNGTNGDGLTNHEEYRGFLENGKFVRTDPRIKNLFVYNGYGADAKPGITLFESITELKVHPECTAEELPESRVINQNTGGITANVVSQHGVRIVTGSKGESPIAVAEGSDPDGFGSPKMTQCVRLPPKSSGAKETAAERTDFRGKVAHELCHSVGVQHHGNMLIAVRWAWIKDASKTDSWQLWEFDVAGDSDSGTELDRDKKGSPIRAIRESDGSELRHGDALPDSGFGYDQKTHSWNLYLNTKQGITSGNETCVMRYGDHQAYLSIRGADLRILPDHSRETFRDALCDSNKGTGVNSENNKPESRAGDAKLGNCKGQIIVNDR